MRSAYVTVGMMLVALLATNAALGFDIQVAPRTLVLSSGGDQVTVHTDVPIGSVDSISMSINGDDVGEIATFADCLGNIVARCGKAKAKEIIGDFDGKTTTATVTLTINGEPSSETITVKK